MRGSHYTAVLPTDVPASSDIHEQLRRYRREWQANARLDALWAVLSLDGKLGDRWDEGEFFATGRQEIEEVFDFMARSGVALPSLGTALDFGCGVGRLTQPLSTRVRDVVGVDIAPEMIRRARSYFPGLTFRLNEREDLSDFPAGSVDLIYTNIVLQHLSNALQVHYVREFSRLLGPRGLAILQIPARRPVQSRRVRTLRMLASMRPRAAVDLVAKAVRGRIVPWRTRMELNVMPKAEVIRVARTCGLALDAIGNINWRTFYAAGRFRVEPEENELDDQREFPLSHLYFFRKPASIPAP